MTAPAPTAALLVLLRPLLLVAACLALVGTGGVELAPRAAGAPAVSVLASATTRPDAPAGPRTDATPPREVLRAALAAASTPSSGASALSPSAGALVAPHLVSAPQGRPPTAPDLPAPHGVPDGRAPPLTTGT